jgi:hypothetical protein
MSPGEVGRFKFSLVAVVVRENNNVLQLTLYLESEDAAPKPIHPIKKRGRPTDDRQTPKESGPEGEDVA